MAYRFGPTAGTTLQQNYLALKDRGVDRYLGALAGKGSVYGNMASQYRGEALGYDEQRYQREQAALANINNAIAMTAGAMRQARERQQARQEAHKRNWMGQRGGGSGAAAIGAGVGAIAGFGLAPLATGGGLFALPTTGQALGASAIGTLLGSGMGAGIGSIFEGNPYGGYQALQMYNDYQQGQQEQRYWQTAAQILGDR